MRLFARLSASLLTATTAFAADLPLGLVDLVEGERMTIVYDSEPLLRPDSMLAIYGVGTLTKHPLTGEVVTQQGALVAKAHILRVAGTRVEARLVWRQDEATVAAGFDAVPLPHEASPDAPPLLQAAIEPVDLGPQETGQIVVPIVDPEGQPVTYRWRLLGSPAASGRLGALSTSRPVNEWTAPGHGAGSQASAEVTAIDIAGNQQTVVVPLAATAGQGLKPGRAMEAFQYYGAFAEPALERIARGPSGTWWGVARKELHLIDVGWRTSRPFALSRDAGVRAPISLAPWRDRLYVLDGNARAVIVLAEDGNQVASIGTCTSPSDLVVDPDGTVFIADQGRGGIAVYESDGRFRALLGEAGSDEGQFQELTRIVRDRLGTLYALDRRTAQIHRYDRFHTRLASWSIPIDGSAEPVDCALLGGRLLVLMTSGDIMRLDERGTASTLASAGGGDLIERLSEPQDLNTDAAGAIIVSYPREKVLVRYDEQGHLSGVRGAPLWNYEVVTYNASGDLYGCDRSSGFIYRHDIEGWRVNRFGGLQRYKGPFEGVPTAMVASADGSSLAALDVDGYAVARFDLTQPGAPVLIIGRRGKGIGEFDAPVDLDVSENGDLFVVDADRHKVIVYGDDGAFKYEFGKYDRGRGSDEINEPKLIAVTRDGRHCYVYDGDRYAIMKFQLGAEDGSAAFIGNTGGRDSEAPGKFYSPVDMACDRQGLVYVLDSSRRDLQMIDYRDAAGYALQAMDLRERDFSSPKSLGMNPDGMPAVFERDQGMAFRW